jgi:hypothetical protein
MNKAETAESTFRDADTFEVGQLNAPIVTHHDVLHMSLTINQSPNLPASFLREFAQLTCELSSQNLLRWNPARVELFNAPQLVCLQARRVTENARNAVSPPRQKFRLTTSI